MRKGPLDIDSRGLIFEAYGMDLTPADCRSIFLDWALGLSRPAGPDDLRTLLDQYAADHPGHPMTDVLRAGLTNDPGPAIRRRRSRLRDRD